MVQPKTPGLLISMAMRSNHAFGIANEKQQVSIVEHVGAFYDKVASNKTYVTTDDAITFKQLCEEMYGEGFYRPEHEFHYRSYATLEAMAKAKELCD